MSKHLTGIKGPHNFPFCGPVDDYNLEKPSINWIESEEEEEPVRIIVGSYFYFEHQ